MEVNKKELLKRLTEARKSLLFKEPFYGTLLMKLKFSLAPCKTACTDMERIMWDPEFLDRLSQDEIEFVMLHEVLHCVLGHCVRGHDKNKELYNIAADIVVNSHILKARGFTEFEVDGGKVMHLTPKKDEGNLYTVEQVYDMLLANAKVVMIPDGHGTVDSHEIWKELGNKTDALDEWTQEILEVVKQKGYSPEGTPSCIREILENIKYASKLNWKEILQDFIQLANDTYDYTFTPADKRFSGSDFILPSFFETETEVVKNLWFVIDTSGSIGADQLSDMFSEIKAALNQFVGLEGKLSFFDTKVTDPIAFDDVKSLYDIKPRGGGGTSFRAIFKYLKEQPEEDLPVAIIIMTDGLAPYPKEEDSLGIPVLWCLVGDYEFEPPWGTVIRI